MFAGLHNPDSRLLNMLLSPGQMIATLQRNISQHRWEQHIAYVWPPCCDVLRHTGCCWFEFENGQIFHATFVDDAWCCSRLARSVQQWCARVWAPARFSIPNTSQQDGQTHANMTDSAINEATGTQHVVPNSVGICCLQMLRSFGRDFQMLSQQCWDMLCWIVAIVLPRLYQDTIKEVWNSYYI